MSNIARHLEGENPFDGYLSLETKQKVEEARKAQEFEELSDEIEKQCRTASENAHKNLEHWSRIQEKEHISRIERSEETVSNEVREQVLLVGDQAHEDDLKYGWITCWDELLQLQSDEEYLRARASFERRLQRARETGEPIKAPWTAARIVLLASYGIVLYISGYVVLDVDLISGIVVGVFLTFVWAFVVRVPGIFSDLTNGTSTRGSGNAV